MKRTGLILAITVLLFATNAVFAQEDAGFVKKTWRKFTGIFRKKTESGEAEAPEEIKPVKPEPRVAEKPPEAGEIPDSGEAPKIEDSPLFQMPVEELIERIMGSLRAMPEIIDFLPEVKVEKDKDNKIKKVEYNVSGTFRELKDVDRESLVKLYLRITNERAKLQSERIHKQLETIRQSQQIMRQGPPKIYKPPSIPKPPVQPPGPPKVPTPPPDAPKPPRR